MLVDSFLEQTAATYPDKAAVVCGDRRVTYRELDAQANQVAHALHDCGVRRHDRVAIHLDNCVEAAVGIFAALKAGAAFVVINPSTKKERLARLTDDCRPAAFVTRELCEAAVRDQPRTPPPRRHIDLDLAALIYTSGSTGGPKGVMLTHRNIATAVTSITGYLENTADDVVLSALPLSFGYGLLQLLTMVKVGGTVVLENGFSYPHRLLEVIAREHVTGLPMVPTIAAILLRMDLSHYALPSLRYITNAGAALPVAHGRELRRVWPHARIIAMYGQTECLRIAYLPHDQLDERPTSVGVPIPNEEVWIVDEQGNEVAPGEVGELVVRGSHVMDGYWNRPQDTERALRPGRFPGERVLYTGDLFRRDADGYLYFISRKDDIIKTRGQKVAPREVEEVLLAMPAIAEAAVVGVPDTVLGAAVKAVVTLRPGEQATALEIQRHCADRLEDFMVPRHIEIRAELPRSAHGKIAKAELVQA